MPTINFEDGVTTIAASWLNDVDDVIFVGVPALQAAMATKAPLDSPEFITPDLGVPSAGDLSACTGHAVSLIAGEADVAGEADKADTLDFPGFTCVQASGILTVAMIAQYLAFRNASLASGVPSVIAAAPADLVLQITDSLGIPTTVSGRIVFALINNAGVAELAVRNITAANAQLNEEGLISTTAISAGATASNVWYSNTARANLPYRIIGAADIVWTTGVGYSTPTVLINAGGMALIKTAEPYIHVRDAKASGTAGGTFTAGAWQTRILNAVESDTHTISTLVSNQLTLPPGTYRFKARAPAYITNQHKIRLQNITAGTTIKVGSSAFSVPNTQTDSVASGNFTLTATSALELQHYCATTRAADGFGLQSTFGVDEVYAELEVWKLN